MISQVSSKEMVAKAYLAGVDFFISKPINLIEVRQVIRNVSQQLENERNLYTIQSVFGEKQLASTADQQREQYRRRLQTTLSQLGMAGEKGAKDIMEMCLYLLERHQQVSQVGVGALCAQLSDSPKSMEQRARRAVERGLTHLASLGVEDYGNEVFTQYGCGPRWPTSRARARRARPTSSASWTACWCWPRRSNALCTAVIHQRGGVLCRNSALFLRKRGKRFSPLLKTGRAMGLRRLESRC